MSRWTSICTAPLLSPVFVMHNILVSSWSSAGLFLTSGTNIFYHSTHAKSIEHYASLRRLLCDSDSIVSGYAGFSERSLHSIMFGFSIWWTPLLALLAVVLVSSQVALVASSNNLLRLAMRT